MIKCCLTDFRPWILVLILQVPSFRAIFKHTPYPIVFASLITVLSFAAYALLFCNNPVRNKITAFFNSYGPTFFLLFIFTVANYFIYPIADALKLVGRGSTADDAMIEPVKSLLAGGNLYDAQLYVKVPISPGPGWILLNIPFTGTGFYFLMTPFYLGLTAIIFMKITGEKAGPNLVLLSLASSLIFWELMVTGHDIVALGCIIITILLLIEKFSHTISNKKSLIFFTGISLLLGAVATSRIIFIILPPLIGVLLWKRNKYFGVGLAVIGLMTAVLLHFYFYTTNEIYQPFHLLKRAEVNLQIPLIVIGGIVSAIGAFFVLIKIKSSFTSWLFWFAFSLAIPLIFISFGELKKVEFDFAKWEGANYFFPVVPAILVYIFNDFSGKKRALKKR